jgi:hypothetical protein
VNTAERSDQITVISLWWPFESINPSANAFYFIKIPQIAKKLRKVSQNAIIINS